VPREAVYAGQGVVSLSGGYILLNQCQPGRRGATSPLPTCS
jgi:hypothetical protein